MTWKWKTSHPNIITPYFSQKRRNLTQHPAEKCMLTILWDYRGIICQEYIVKGTKINSKTEARTLERLKRWINPVNHWNTLMLLQYDNTTPQTSTATAAATESIGFTLFNTLPTAWIRHHLTSVCRCQETHQRNSSHLWQRSSSYGKMILRTAWNSRVKGSKYVFSMGATILNERESTWKSEVKKQSTHSEQYSTFCFIGTPCLGVRTQMCRHYCLNTFHTWGMIIEAWLLVQTSNGDDTNATVLEIIFPQFIFLIRLRMY